MENESPSVEHPNGCVHCLLKTIRTFLELEALPQSMFFLESRNRTRLLLIQQCKEFIDSMETEADEIEEEEQKKTVLIQ